MADNMSDVSSHLNTSYSTMDCLSNLKTLQIDHNYNKCVTIDGDGKLKWKENYEALKDFVKKILKLNGKWSSPGGHLKLFSEAQDSIIIRYYTNSTSLLFQGEKGESFANILIQKLSTMHSNTEVEVMAENFPCESEKAEELQMMCDVTISDQPQGTSTFCQGILTEEIKQKPNKQVDHGDEVISIDDYSQTVINMTSHPVDQNQETIYNYSQTKPETVTINKSNTDLLKYISQLETKMLKSFDIITSDLHELRSITELSLEIRSSCTFNENLSLREEISCLKEKINNQSCLISDLNYNVKELKNERNSLLTVVKILQAENQNLFYNQQQQQISNLNANMNNLQQPPPTLINQPEQQLNYQCKQQQQHYQKPSNNAPQPQQKQQLLPQHQNQHQQLVDYPRHNIYHPTQNRNVDILAQPNNLQQPHLTQKD